MKKDNLNYMSVGTFKDAIKDAEPFLSIQIKLGDDIYNIKSVEETTGQVLIHCENKKTKLGE